MLSSTFEFWSLEAEVEEDIDFFFLKKKCQHIQSRLGKV